MLRFKNVFTLVRKKIVLGKFINKHMIDEQCSTRWFHHLEVFAIVQVTNNPFEGQHQT